MPQVVGPLFTALAGSFATTTTGVFVASSGAVIGTTVTSTAVGGLASGMLLKAIGQIIIGTALSAISRAIFSPDQGITQSGTRVQLQFGEDNPLSFIMGTYATDGELLYHNSWGNGGDDTPNEYYVQVIELSDLPCRLNRVWVNGEWCKLKKGISFGHSTYSPGYAVEGYENDGEDRLFIKFHDGTQTEADNYLLEKFGDDPDRPWTSQMKGLGMAYAIVTAGVRGSTNRQRPICRFELSAWGHYDRRKDSTHGGNGAQRWNNWRTWKPSDNPVVMIDNILRGIKDPITNEFIWGGQDTDWENMPASVWFAAMNACDAIRSTSGGNEPEFRAGIEIVVSDEPASVIDHLLKACIGTIAEIAGEWQITVGGPSASVYNFSDDDIVITSPDDFKPIKSLVEAYNGVSATYPEPNKGWVNKDAPIRRSVNYLEEDLGKENIASIEYRTVPYRSQVVRLMKFALNDERRMRTHVFSLPPECRALSPLDIINYTSVRNGYINKKFSIELVEDLPDGTTAVAIRERNPDDYNFEMSDEIADDDPGFEVRPPRPRQVADFTVEPATITGDAGEPRAPAIRLNWNVYNWVTGIRFKVRLASNHNQVHVDTGSNKEKAEVVSVKLIANSTDVIANSTPVFFNHLTDVSSGTVLISGKRILPNTAYQVIAIYEPVGGRDWTEWADGNVTTPNIRIQEQDLDDVVLGHIQEARDRADEARDLSLATQTIANETQALVSGLGAETLENLQALVDDLAGLDTGSILELRGIAVAGLQRGWAKDPTFAEWTAGVPTYWTGFNIAAYATKVPGFYPSAFSVVVPSSVATNVTIIAASNVTDQLPGVDLNAEYVVLSLMMRAISGSIETSKLRIDWRETSTGTWIRGHAFGVNNSFGDLESDWGISVHATRMHSREIVWKRPISGTDALRIFLDIKQSTQTEAVTVRIDYLDVRLASEAEIKGYLANDYADAQISEFSAIILGPAGAIATEINQLSAEFDQAQSLVTSQVVALASEVESLSGTILTVEASFGAQNQIKNPTFEDGAKVAGVLPLHWLLWPSNASVIPRGVGTASAVINAPTRFIAQSIGDGLLQIFIPHNYIPIKPNQHIQMGIRYAASGSSINVPMEMRVRWFSADASTVISTNSKDFVITSVIWQSVIFSPIKVPEGISYYDVQIRRKAGGTLNTIYFTGVESKIVDDAAFAVATEALVASADAELAISSITSVVAAEYGTFSSFVEQTSTAIASAEMAASALVFRAVAGGGSAGIRLVAWDNPTGVGGAIMLDGAQVIAEGTLSASQLVIADLGLNMVPDDQLQSQTAWKGNNVFTLVSSPVGGNAGSDSKGFIRFNKPSPMVGPYNIDSMEFPVSGGDRLTCRYQVDRTGTSGRVVVSGRIRFLDRVGSFIGMNMIGSEIDTTGSGLITRKEAVTVPNGSFTARFRFQIEPQTNADVVRFYAPSVIRRSDASVLITPDGAFMDELTAKTAWIKTANIINGNITTAKIDGFAITDDVDIQRNQTIAGTGMGDGQWINYLSVTVNIPNDDTRVQVLATTDSRNEPGGNLQWEFELTYGPDNIRLNGGKSASEYYQSCTTVMGFRNFSSGNYTFRLRFRAVSDFEVTRASMVISQRKR